MPAAKKPRTSTSASRSRSGAAATRATPSRRDVERRIARVEKLLGDAGDALTLLGRDMGRGAGDAYKELIRTAKALRRDAERTNKRMLKDLDQLRTAATPSGAAASASRTARSGRARSNTRQTAG